MTDTKATPGPWRYDQGLNVLAGKRVVANCNSFTSSDDDTRPENTANARLIAEAGTVCSETGLSPRELAEQREELLGACQVALKNGDNCLGEETKALLRAAIRKARGEPVLAV